MYVGSLADIYSRHLPPVIVDAPRHAEPIPQVGPRRPARKRHVSNSNSATDVLLAAARPHPLTSTTNHGRPA